MSQDLKNFKCVSSLVVFRKMYENRQSIYDIISEFAKTIIIARSLKIFELHEMCNYLKDEYGVRIVPAVVKTALKRLSFLKRERNRYTLKTNLSDKEIKHIAEQIQQSKISISDILDDYVEYKRLKENTKTFDESKAKEELCKFIVDGKFVDESDIGIISAFIIDRKGDKEFEQACKCIREGLIIYNGLSYTTDGVLVENLDTPLTIYLETELLFHATGLNGTLYKSLFSDFYQIVSEINEATTKHNGKKIISLAYFPETKKEVDKYFAQAEILCKNQRKLDPSKSAMKTILNGCSSVADIKQKEIEFWIEIGKMGIQVDEMSFDISNEYYAPYNLSEYSDIPDSSIGDEDNKIYDIGQMLSKVNYIRRNVNPRIFRTIRAIVLTGNRNTLFLSDKHTKTQEVPFATTLSYLTNRFWFSLHKGLFSNESTVPGANIITMAQVAFSQKVNESLMSEYEKIRQQFDEGIITKDRANEIIAGFKLYYLQPENVTKEIVDNNFCFDLFNGDAIEQVKAEYTMEKQKHLDEIASKDATIRKLIEEKNAEEKRKHQKDLTKYNESMELYIRKSIRKLWLKNITIFSSYIFAFVLAVILAYCINVKIAGLLLVVAIAFPITERFVRPFTNRYVEMAFKWIFSKKVRMDCKDNIVGEFTKNNPQPQLKESTVESYNTGL